MTIKNEYFPETVTHPGFTLNEKLEEIGMSIKEFALRTQKPEQTIIKIINENGSITPDMSILFENVLKIPAKFWLKRQYLFDESIARIKRFAVIEESKEWAKCFPYASMAKLGWVPKTRKLEKKIDSLFQFFGLSGKAAWENYYYKQMLKVIFRISLKHIAEPYAVSAWLRQGEIIASKMEVANYNAKMLKKNLANVKQLMIDHPNNFFITLQDLCKNAGVKVVYTPCLPKAPINGSTRWLGNTPLIQLSARYKQNDIFWFTFFHEVGHILLHGKKYVSLENIKFDDIDLHKEEEANEFAISWTLSEKQEQEILNHQNITEDSIISFAKKYDTHPAIIIGRLHHKK
ncbi:XRE family transcriptional regulator, partial [Candidatus Magnetomorum sp. HK-1]